MQLLENFSHAKQWRPTARRRSGVNFPRAQIILDYEQSPAAGGSELNFPETQLLLQPRPEVAV